MLQTHRWHPSKAVLLQGTQVADDHPRHHPHDLQGLQKWRTINLSFHPAVSDRNDDEPQSQKIVEERLLASQKLTHLHHHRTHDQLEHPSPRLHQRLHLPPPPIIGHQGIGLQTKTRLHRQKSTRGSRGRYVLATIQLHPEEIERGRGRRHRGRRVRLGGRSINGGVLGLLGRGDRIKRLKLGLHRGVNRDRQWRGDPDEKLCPSRSIGHQGAYLDQIRPGLDLQKTQQYDNIHQPLKKTRQHLCPES